jgi:hypothetical protein
MIAESANTNATQERKWYINTQSYTNVTEIGGQLTTEYADSGWKVVSRSKSHLQII